MTLERVQIVTAISPGENPPVHRRVQRLHPAVHHFGEPRDLGDARHRDSCVREGASRATCRHQLISAGRQTLAELDEIGLV